MISCDEDCYGGRVVFIYRVPFILGDAVQFNASGLSYGATFNYML